MRWRWWRHAAAGGDDPAHQRAEQAIEISREQAAEAKRRLAEAQHLAERFRELRRRNHFAESIRQALGEGR